jgi:SAM-dependent methyltransferase
MAATEHMSAQQIAEQRDALVGRLFQSALGTFELFTVYLGDRLGLFRALAEADWASPTELASRADIAQRYAQEWLEQQAVMGILEVDDAGAEPSIRRYRLPVGHREVLLDRDSMNYLTWLSRFAVCVPPVMPKLLDAYRTGGGVPWAAYGADAREGQAEQNRAVFFELLTKEWLPSIPEVHARLQADPPARVLDVGCGGGWLSIAIARAYPNVRVDGFDLDAASVALAHANVAASGVADRVNCQARDMADPHLSGRYDLAICFEMVHDLARPVEVLRAVRNTLAENGTVIVVDEKVADGFTAPGDELERLFYSFSVLFCLPNGLAESPSSGTGTMLRPSILRRYGLEAGYRDTEILPIAHDFFRIYRLVP